MLPVVTHICAQGFSHLRLSSISEPLNVEKTAEFSQSSPSKHKTGSSLEGTSLGTQVHKTMRHLQFSF